MYKPDYILKDEEEKADEDDNNDGNRRHMHACIMQKYLPTPRLHTTLETESNFSGGVTNV